MAAPAVTTAANLPSALASWPAVGRRLRLLPPALFLDYDGTLTPIVERPEDAILSATMREAVRTVAEACPVTVVSGRDRAVVEALVGLPGLGYVGSHGFDIRGPAGSGLRHEVGADRLPALDEAERHLRDRLAQIPGALVERKRFGVAAHYRLAADRRVDVEKAVNEAHREFPGLGVAAGKAVLELRPAVDWNKGLAIRWLLDRLPEIRGVPIHIGDDLTDETAFETLAADGIGIVVAEDDRATAAQFALRDPEEVRRFLERLVGELRRAGG